MSGRQAAAVPEPAGPAEPLVRTAGGVVREVSAPPAVPPAEHGSLGDIPFDNAAEAPGEALLGRKRADGTWRDMTCEEFAEEVAAAAKGLIAHGLKPGDRLAVMSRTRYEWTLLDFAAWAAGLVTVPLYPTSSVHQVRWALRDARVAACAVEGPREARMVASVRGETPDLAHLWQLDAGGLEQIAAAGRDVPDALVDERRSLLGPDAVATLIHTSGTTSRPKVCALTHGNFLAEVDNVNELLHPLFRGVSDEPAATLLFLPMAHVLGRTIAVGCLRARVRLGHAPSLRADELLADLAGFAPTFLVAIPYVLEKVFNTARAAAERRGAAAVFDSAVRVARAWGEAQEALQHGRGPGPGPALRTAHAVYDALVYRRIRAALGGKVRYVVCGGSPLGRRLATFYAGAGIDVHEGYGLAETTAAVTVNPPGRLRMGTVGRPVPGMAVRIADDGEVLLRGAQVFGGYWNSEDGSVVPATDSDGWLPTGDIGALDADGYLTITGRKKDLIITSSGKNIAPAPLEDWLRAHPLIEQCLVVGDGRPHLVALITLDSDGLAHWRRMRGKEDVPPADLVEDPELLGSLQRAVDEANRLVSRAEAIRRFRVLPTAFTEESGHLTPSMKVRRAAVLRDFAAEIDALYAP